MSATDQRAALERLIRDRREDYAGLSRLLGKNAAYIQQFIKRGSPKKLAPDDVTVLARYFGISEAALGGSPTGADSRDLVRVPRLNVNAAAGHGAWNEGDASVAHIGFDPNWLRRLCSGSADALALIRVQGDSMVPTLADGDDILVDAADNRERLRDGIYVLRRDEMLFVKRLAVSPATQNVTLKSDNSAYPEWRDCDLASLEVIGRVVWAGRRVS
jgi:phage repressor protein C with HTH and peptisase S24 domain